MGQRGEERSSDSKDSLLGDKESGDEAGSRESVLTLGKMRSVLAILCTLPTHTRGFPDSSVGKESTCNAGDPGSIPWLGRFPGEGKGYPLRNSGLQNSTSPWGCKESDMTECFSLSLHFTTLHFTSLHFTLIVEMNPCPNFINVLEIPGYTF